MSIVIHVNGEPRTVDPGTTVEALAHELTGGAGGRGIAVALDGTVVPASAWSQTPVRTGARLEILVAVQGG